jgi:hypothetical protein
LMVAWLIVIGATVAAYLLTSNQTLSTTQMQQVKTACLQCHSSVPAYNSPRLVHDTHFTLNCYRCHNDTPLKTASDVHRVLEWLAVLLAGGSLAAIAANFVLVARRRRRTS